MSWPSPTRALSRRSIPLPTERFGLEADAAEAIVRRVEAQYLGPHPGRSARRKFRAQLHLEDLLLAHACAAGIEAAWETFWQRYQPQLRKAALAVTHEPSRAQELADGLLADLFGMRTRDGQRVSKLTTFTGIGSLDGWLVALLARAHVDTWRRERRNVSLDAKLETAGALQAHVIPTPLVSASQPHLEAALETVLGNVDETARLLLSLYFLDGKTLAEIGALLQVHESTVSRRLDRVLVQVRRQTRRELSRRGVAPAASAAIWKESAELDPRRLHVNVRKALGVAAPTITGAPRGH